MIRTIDDVTPTVLAAMEQTADPRLREILVSLVTHLHAMVREVGLTEDEFRAATTIVNRIGQASNDRHNEAVLMAGSLGLSSLVCLLNNTGGVVDNDTTSQNLLGPFYRPGQPVTEQDGSIVRSPTPGDPLFVRLRLIDQDDQPVSGATVDIWQASPQGRYENQDDTQAEHNLRGRFTSDDDGEIRFRSVRPAGYPIPTNGVVGQLLAAQNRHPFRPAHLHVLAHKPGFTTLISQIYDADDPHLDSDVQFGVTEALLGRMVPHTDSHPHHADLDHWVSLDHTLVMRPGEASLPEAPIR